MISSDDWSDYPLERKITTSWIDMDIYSNYYSKYSLPLYTMIFSPWNGTSFRREISFKMRMTDVLYIQTMFLSPIETCKWIYSSTEQDIEMAVLMARLI